MIILRSEAEFAEKASVVALGMFDGVHAGHQKLIRTAVDLAKQMNAKSVVCTFDRHPMSVLKPEFAPEPLLPLDKNLKKIEKLGADYALVQAFTREFAAILPEDFLEMLADKLYAKAIVIGENYTFGRAGLGSANMVKQLSKKYGYHAKIVEPVRDEEGMISSTRIRRMLKDGKTAQAKQLLDIH